MSMADNVAQNNFERITESPEALAEFLETFENDWCGVCDFIGGCTECPLENCTEMEHERRELWMWWLMKKEAT